LVASPICPGIDAAAVAQHRVPVRDLAHLLEEVADVDHRDAARPQPADEVEEPLDVRTLQAAGGLVHQHDARVGAERPTDLDHLLRRHGQLAHAAVGPDLGVREVLEQRQAHGVLAASRSTHPQAGALRPSRMFSVTVRCGQSDSSWWIRAIPGAAALQRR
jgi:hypothetical protein